nr:MAG TPA: hypothetical protein [Caudoviricetes sp.]
MMVRTFHYPFSITMKNLYVSRFDSHVISM